MTEAPLKEPMITAVILAYNEKKTETKVVEGYTKHIVTRKRSISCALEHDSLYVSVSAEIPVCNYVAGQTSVRDLKSKTLEIIVNSHKLKAERAGIREKDYRQICANNRDMYALMTSYRFDFWLRLIKHPLRLLNIATRQLPS